MNLDETAGAYGSLQVVYAEVSDRLAGAVSVLRQRKDPDGTFETPWQFTKLVAALRTELKQFEGHDSVADSLHAVTSACDQASALATWRNDRIHARVRQDAVGLALYHAKTGERLSISREECENITRDLVNVSVSVQTHLQYLAGAMDLDKAIAAAFAELTEDIMNITEYAWLTVTDGTFTSCRPVTPALSELVPGAPIDSVLQNLAVAEWHRSDAKPIPALGNIEIQIQRSVEYHPPTGNSAAVSLDDEHEGSFEEQVQRVQRRYEVNGWDFHRVIFAVNMGPRLIFTKPGGTPDTLPFAEPNITE